MYKIIVPKKVAKQVRKLRSQEKDRLEALLDDLRETGPIQPRWSRYSQLGDGRYHCHLSYRWVACWRDTGDSLVLEVYYVGSRENAPY